MKTSAPPVSISKGSRVVQRSTTVGFLANTTPHADVVQAHDGDLQEVINEINQWLIEREFSHGASTTLDDVHAQGFDIVDSVELAIYLHENAPSDCQRPKPCHCEWHILHWDSTVYDYAKLVVAKSFVMKKYKIVQKI